MKNYEYSGVEDGTPIDSVMGVQQALHCLDLAGEIAADKKDVDGLVRLATGWLEFGASVEAILPHNPGDETEDEKPSAKGKKLESYGFAKAIIEKAGDEEDGESGVTDED